MHLGKKPAANRPQAEAVRLLYRHQAEPCGDPLEALQRLAGRALALEQTIGKMVNDLECDPVRGR